MDDILDVMLARIHEQQAMLPSKPTAYQRGRLDGLKDALWLARREVARSIAQPPTLRPCPECGNQPDVTPQGQYVCGCGWKE